MYYDYSIGKKRRLCVILLRRRFFYCGKSLFFGAFLAKNVERKDSLLRGRLLEGFFYFPPAFFLPFYIFPLEYPFDVDDVGVVVGFGLLTFYWSLTHFKNGAVTNGGITMLFVAKKMKKKKKK